MGGLASAQNVGMSAPHVDVSVPLVPMPAPPVRSRNTGLIIGIIVAVLASMVFAVGAGVAVSRLRSGKSLTQTGVHTGDIRAELLPIPAGATVWSKWSGADGLFSAEDADRFFGVTRNNFYDSTMHECGFTTGGIRAWQDSAGRYVIERMFRLDSAPHAQEFLEQVRGIEITSVQGTDSHDLSDQHTIGDVTLGMTLMYPTARNGYRNMLALGVKGDTAFIFLVDLKTAVDPAFAADLLHQQAARL